jgi:protein-S-isoprenylcysteine O-methyltransferase Ste14
MNHRIADLPIEKGWRRKLAEIRYKEIYRQSLAIILFIFYALIATPPARMIAISAAVIVIIGALIRLWAAGVVMKNEQLATSGPYGYVRHPLYVGNILGVGGMTVISGTWWAYLITALFFWLFYPTTIKYEDSKLENIFGEPWRQWSSKVRALIPRLTPYSREAMGWSIRRAAGRNGEAAIFIYVLVCLGIALLS